MALTNSGFNGSVTEADWAYMAAIGMFDGVESDAAWRVTQGTGRQVSVAAHNGRAFARGVLSRDTVPITLPLGTPTNGQWHLIVRRINWTAKTVSVVAIPHTTTTTAVPSVAPTTLPVMNDVPGALYDQKLAWAWVNSVNTTLTIFDLRSLVDTGYITATAAAGWSLQAGNEAKFRRLRTLVNNTGAFSPNANGNLTSAFVTIGTLPAGMAPAANILLAGFTSLSVLCQFQINTAGIVQVRTLAGTTAYTTNTQFSLAGYSWTSD